MNHKLRGVHCALQEQVTDAYIIIMLLVFPLFPGFSGYSSITASKFILFMAVTGLWLLFLLSVTLCERIRVGKLSVSQLAALVYLLVCAASLIFSENWRSAFIGAGRYDGFLTTAACVFIFLGVSRFTRPKPKFVSCFSLAVSLSALISILQLAGRNPLGLYPAELSFYDAGLKYSGTFLGTIGNTNIYDSLLCLALPLFAGLYICEQSRIVLLPVLLSVPVIIKAGGDGSKLALFVVCLVAMPLLLTKLSRVRRALRCAAYSLVLIALSLLWHPNGGHTLAFTYSPNAVVAASAGLMLLVLGIIPLPKDFSPSGKCWRTVSLILIALIILLAIWAVFAAESGTLYEFAQVLQGNAEDHFGSSRIGIWRACLALVPEHPILGGGPGTLALRLNMEFSRYVPETGITLRSFVDNAHNVYLAALVNTGLLGLLSLLWFLFCCAKSAFRRRSAPLTLSFALGALCCAVQEFFGLGLCLSTPIFWIFLALISSHCSESYTLEDGICLKKTK